MDILILYSFVFVYRITLLSPDEIELQDEKYLKNPNHFQDYGT